MRIILPEALRELAGGQAVVEVAGGEEAPRRGPGSVGVGLGRVGGAPGRVGVGLGRVGGAPARVGGALGTVGGVLGELRVAHTGLYDRLMTEQGILRPHVNIFVDGENIRFAGGLETAVGEGSEILVLPAISGG